MKTFISPANYDAVRARLNLLGILMSKGNSIEPDDEGDGGEELSVPTISKAALAKMQPVTTGAQ